MRHALTPATEPTLYFIGVTTGRSSINAIFPRWVERLGIGRCRLRGLDFPLQDKPEHYRAVIDFIKRDPLSRGALITSHKIDLYRACHDQIEEIEPLARSLGEISSVFKRGAVLHGRAIDVAAEGHALDAFLPPGNWRSGAEALILGAGGAGTALSWHLTRIAPPANQPARVHVADRDPGRLEHLRKLHASSPDAMPLILHRVESAEAADALVARLPPGSLVVNATGMGKDTPGSPLTDAAVFPDRGFAWELNYRGQLVFLAQARAQEKARRLRVEDGWTCFLHGWTRVMADVFAIEIPTSGPVFAELGRIAAERR